MAVVNTKSTWLTNADAQPIVPTDFRTAGGFLRGAKGVVAVAAADDDTSVYRVIRLPSNARIWSINVLNDAITGGTSYDIGVYKKAADGGAVVSVALFGSAIDLSSAHASTGPLDVTFEATATDISKQEKALWELLGLSVDPGLDYDICLTANTVGSAAGNIVLRATFEV